MRRCLHAGVHLVHEVQGVQVVREVQGVPQMNSAKAVIIKEAFEEGEKHLEHLEDLVDSLV